MVFGEGERSDGHRGPRRRKERCRVCLLFVAHQVPSPDQTSQVPRVFNTESRELRFSAQDLWERCLTGGRKKRAQFMSSLISCHDHLQEFQGLSCLFLQSPHGLPAFLTSDSKLFILPSLYYYYF